MEIEKQRRWHEREQRILDHDRHDAQHAHCSSPRQIQPKILEANARNVTPLDRMRQGQRLIGKAAECYHLAWER
jgi:hypothetical protein